MHMNESACERVDVHACDNRKLVDIEPGLCENAKECTLRLICTVRDGSATRGEHAGVGHSGAFAELRDLDTKMFIF